VTDDEVASVVRDIVARFNKEGRALGPETRLAADLGMDSVAAMDLVMELEDRLDIDVPLNRLGEVETLAQLVELVRQRLQGD
jgi:acyl carrier protein